MAAAAVTGWYGPLIDLSRAASHVGDFVQLLVLVRHYPSHPIQVKFRASNRGAMHRTLIQIGDNTRAFFCLSIANNHLGSTMHAGDVVLLQNVKLARYAEVFEAVATQISSVQVLIHSCQLVSMIGVDELIACCKVGINTREKLKKVVEWAHKTESLLRSIKQVPYHNGKQSTKNWKSQEENKSRNCTSVSEVLCLTESCKINFLACIGEIILQSQRPHEVVKNKLLLGKRLLRKADSIVEDIICTGCTRCGCPINSRLLDGMEFPLYCQNSGDYHHSVSFIYQPLLLYVWDHSKHITLLVRNKAAEMLFGNITAEDVYKCFEVVKLDALRKQEPRPNDGGPLYSEIPNGTESTNGSQQLECRKVAKHTDYTKKLDSYSIWLLLIKLLLHNENSPFKFEVSVNLETDKDSGRFELVSLTMPHYVADGG
uniref:Ferrochelatase n=2 Tax=Anthurium amnicola TaxID=1678845 RepID=A0A1D1XSD4_9ARAE